MSNDDNHQSSYNRLIDYTDQVSGGLFHLYQIVTKNYPEPEHIDTILRLMNIVNTDLKNTIQNIRSSNGVSKNME